MITFLIHTLPLCLRRMNPEGNVAALPVYRILPLLLLIPPGRVSMPASPRLPGVLPCAILGVYAAAPRICTTSVIRL